MTTTYTHDEMLADLSAAAESFDSNALNQIDGDALARLVELQRFNEAVALASAAKATRSKNRPRVVAVIVPDPGSTPAANAAATRHAHAAGLVAVVA